MHSNHVSSDDELACEKCSYIPIHSKDMSRHKSEMHSSHENIDVFFCNRCDFSTQHEDTLKKHIQNKHSQQSRVFHSSARKRQAPFGSKAPAQSQSDSFIRCCSCEFKTKSKDTINNISDSNPAFHLNSRQYPENFVN